MSSGLMCACGEPLDGPGQCRACKLWTISWTYELLDRPGCPCGKRWYALRCEGRLVTVRCHAGHQPRDWPPEVRIAYEESQQRAASMLTEPSEIL